MNENELLTASKERWNEAQIYEKNVWIKRNQKNSYFKLIRRYISLLIKNPMNFLNAIQYYDFYCGDDGNLWWLKQFIYYRILPKDIEKALEVGCGPFTNIRLISKYCKIKEIYCCDPSLDLYKTFKLTWLVRQIQKNNINVLNDKCEILSYKTNYFDLVICINVLDHVQDAICCLREIERVTKTGGFLVLGQDLTNIEDIEKLKGNIDEMGHPIKINHITIDNFLKNTYKSCLKKILPRNKGRNPRAHYGTYLFIGQKI